MPEIFEERGTEKEDNSFFIDVRRGLWLTDRYMHSKLSTIVDEMSSQSTQSLRTFIHGASAEPFAIIDIPCIAT